MNDNNSKSTTNDDVLETAPWRTPAAEPDGQANSHAPAGDTEATEGTKPEDDADVLPEVSPWSTVGPMVGADSDDERPD